MSKELKKAEQAAHAYDGLGAPMHVAELRRQVIGPDFNGVVRSVPERFSCEPVPPKGAEGELAEPNAVKPCPCCGVRLHHIESAAKSFDPPRTYHEWHHEDNGCWLRERIGRIILTSTDDEAKRAETIAAWNRRAESELSRIREVEPVAVKGLVDAPDLTPMSGFLVFLKDMRFTGSWDLPTLNRAIEVGETIVSQSLASPTPSVAALQAENERRLLVTALDALEAVDSEIALTGHLKELVDCALSARAFR